MFCLLTCRTSRYERDDIAFGQYCRCSSTVLLSLTSAFEYEHLECRGPYVTQFLLLPSKYIPAEDLLKSPRLAVLTHIRITTRKPSNGFFLRILIWKIIRCIFGPFRSPFSLDNLKDKFTLNLTAFLLAWAYYRYSVNSQKFDVPFICFCSSISWPINKENIILDIS